MGITRGIVYIAVGSNAVDMAIASANSIIATSSQLPSITIFCDCYPHLSSNEISFINLDIQTKNLACLAAYLKTQLHELSPYDKTLYLDADIRAVKDISEIWQLVNDGMGLSPAFSPLIPNYRYPQHSEADYTASIITNWDQYNAGMFLFVKSRSMSSLFNSWQQEYRRFNNHENMALTRVLDSTRSNITKLSRRFNDFYPNRDDESILIHYISHYKRYM